MTSFNMSVDFIVLSKEAFNRKISLLASKLNIELRKKLVRCYVMIGALLYMAGNVSIWRVLKYGTGGEWRR